MNKQMPFIGLAVLLLALLLTVFVVAQTSTSFDLSWHVLGGGGGQTTGSAYAINFTLGQGTVGWISNSNSGMGVGYWYGVEGVYRVFLPLIVRDYSSSF